MPQNITLTPVELELMEILWKIGQGTVHDVINKLPKNRALAYTSVSTILRILQDKKVVTVEKNGRQHIYQPKLNKQTYAANSLKKMVNQIFSGNNVELVSYLMRKNDLSKDELNEIQLLIETKKKEMGDA